jgi:catechol 2,3-dioxygenase-like lactoylglutathione lyase family enzyme
MARVQLALNVADIDDAVDFYSTVFRTEPAKRRPGYANFEIADPPLKLVLFEGLGEPATLNHLGVEVAGTDEVAATTERVRAAGLDTQVEDAQTCCYATQDKVWVTAPDGQRWEFYTVLADSPTFFGEQDSHCCVPQA